MSDTQQCAYMMCNDIAEEPVMVRLVIDPTQTIAVMVCKRHLDRLRHNEVMSLEAVLRR
jgi:hypothetical protein